MSTFNSGRFALALTPLLAALGFMAPAAQAQTTTYISSTINDGSFETPSTTSFVANPTGTPWTYAGGDSGVSTNGSQNSTYACNGTIPNGTQYAYMQVAAASGISTASVSQSFTLLTASNVSLSYYVGGRNGGAGGATTFTTTLSSAASGTSTLFTGTTSATEAFTQESSTVNNLAAGTYTVKFTSSEIGAATGDNTALLDNVTLTGAASAPEPAALLLLAPGVLGMVGMVARRRRTNAAH